jgi:hypothetical protein
MRRLETGHGWCWWAECSSGSGLCKLMRHDVPCKSAFATFRADTVAEARHSAASAQTGIAESRP